MKRYIFIFSMLACMFLSAQTYVRDWGMADFDGWPVLNDSTTPAGDASMGDQIKDDNAWASLRGSFGHTVEANLDSAVIVNGQLEFVGSDMGISYNPLRYALTWQEDEGILKDQYTDSSRWSVTGNHYGYEFAPTSGNLIFLDIIDPPGTVFTIVNGNWASIYTNNGWEIAEDNQRPHGAEMPEGIYNWAISVQPLADCTNEVRWYMVYEDSTSYWYGGIALDTAQVTTRFNGICFAIGYDIPDSLIRFNLTEVQVDKGEPIAIPKAPWVPYYITEWGLADFHGWPILNDDMTIVGDAGIGGDTRDGPATLRGSFGQDVEISTEKAIIVKAELEFVGGSGGSDYNTFRYALTRQSDEGELLYESTDSMQWSVHGGHSGYRFHPRTGTATMSNGFGGKGTVWTINNGNWYSNYSNNGEPVAVVDQSPVMQK